MKLNCWILLGAMLSTSLLAQQVADAPPSAPLGTTAPAASTNAAAGASVTNAAAPKATSKKKTAAKKKAPKKTDTTTELKTVPLVAGPATVAANHVNVRGQAKLNSEVVTRLTNGQPVTVIEEITRNNSGPDEPSAWAKIQLPPGAHTWINTTYLDENKAVKPKKLNLRAGPGENYSVLGQLQGGEIVNPVNTKGGWSEIEPPTNAYAFVAAQYLKQEAPGALASTPATTATVAEAPVIAAATTDTSTTNATSETAATTNAMADATTADATSTAPATEEPPPKRIVQREGMVRGTFSIQAPTHFELISPENGKTIDYLYTTAPSLDLRRYKGLRIIVTGEEGLEERWGNTPMLTIQKIQVLE
jgi:uncharacterized protein YgiM (DUF1202 family)